MKILLLLLFTGLPLLLLSPWGPVVAGALAQNPDAALPTGLLVEPDARNRGFYQLRLPARHRALQVSVLDAQNHPVQPARLVAAATPHLLLDARQWPPGRYQVQIRSAAGLISTSLVVP
jgi:hypothetical protein